VSLLEKQEQQATTTRQQQPLDQELPSVKVQNQQGYILPEKIGRRSESLN